MRGLNVNGFIISETLGSGRAGLLYLARNPSTGQEAIICLSSGGDEGLTAKIFLEEATSLRPTTRELSRAKTSDGRPALLAVVPTEDKTAPLPSVGNTRHANTELLPSRRPNRAPLVVLLLGLLTLGAGLALIVMQRRDAGPSVIVVQSPPTHPPPPAPVPEPAPAVAMPRALEPVPVPDPPPKPIAAPRKPAPVIVCDARWQRAAEVDLANLRRVVAGQNDDGLFMRYEKAEEALMIRMSTLKSPAECAQVNSALDALIAKYSN